MKKIILALIGIMVFLIGCTGDGSAGETVGGRAFIGGTDSIKFDFSGWTNCICSRQG